ncbi:MAG: Uma2 family endonuclease [Myxococcales bacterium]|nr:Uma2 family endonuclease [Myxococcales bacterium]
MPSSAIRPSQSATAPIRFLPKRPPRVPQVVRNPKPDLQIADIDWTAWHLTAEQDMAESPQHAEISRVFVQLLRRRILELKLKRSYVNGNTFFQWVPDEPLVQISPDAYVLDSAPRPLPTSFQTWLAGHHPPRFALEVVSEQWHKDYDANPAKYAMLGCRELVIYDPEHDQHRRTKERVAIQVYRRAADGIFARAYAGDGPAYCEAVDGWLVASANAELLLRIARDPAGQDLVPTAEESEAAAQEQATAAQEQATAAQEQATAAQEQAAAAQEQAAAAQELAAVERTARQTEAAENVRLRAELAGLRGAG